MLILTQNGETIVNINAAQMIAIDKWSSHGFIIRAVFDDCEKTLGEYDNLETCKGIILKISNCESNVFKMP